MQRSLKHIVLQCAFPFSLGNDTAGGVTSFVVDIPVETSVVVLIPLTLIQFVGSSEPCEAAQLEQPFADSDVITDRRRR